ncbi:MAG TPA: type IV pilus biogenesis/stability protein PilW [Aquabacterium sp.]|uniref:type IV pilus biogenesis/stability protein PilW n=1 Tax=Aquabacterium sp. TaxID=1872578 RepID=UPI002E37B63B|nr:type IV pilus biogenesis/stability protein PilW [Aquabacterium sp.]HEX5374124.1 type IV pilus biogenesis/stability protein PilW [Aquabacterium sp.]
MYQPASSVSIVGFRRALGTLVLSAGLWAIAGLPQAVHAQSGSGEVSDSAAGRDLTTASDETATRRRARIRLELAAAYFGQGQLSTALDEVKQALSMDSTYQDAFELRGLIYDALNEPGFADESFRRALQLNERNGSVLHNYAWFLCRKQEYARADAYFARAAELPTSVSTAKTLMARGVCQLRAGLLPEAEKSLLRSHELDPSNPATAFNLAQVLYRKGDYERARFYIRRVNNITERANAESLWLGARIEHKMGNIQARDELATQLRSRFSASREVTAMELGRYDD